MAEQNFLTVRLLSLNPDDRWIRAVSIFDMFYWQKAEISVDSMLPRVRRKETMFNDSIGIPACDIGDKKISTFLLFFR